jgi:hypothetical protein
MNVRDKQKLVHRDLSICRFKLEIKYTITDKESIPRAIELFTDKKEINNVTVSDGKSSVRFQKLSRYRVDLFQKMGLNVEFGTPFCHNNKKSVIVVNGIWFDVDNIGGKYTNGMTLLVPIYGATEAACRNRANRELYGAVDKLLGDHNIKASRECMVGTECMIVYDESAKNKNKYLKDEKFLNSRQVV